MQIKMKPDKPTEPGDYVCIRRHGANPEYIRIEQFHEDGFVVLNLGNRCGLYAWDALEDGSLFSGRIDLVVEEVTG